MKFIFLLFTLCFMTVSFYGQQLKGTVKTIDGTKVEKAVIRPGFVETDKDGKFILKNAAPSFIFVQKIGFRPAIIKLNKEAEIEIFLEVEKEESKLKIPECSQKLKGKNVGVNIKLFVPKGFSSQKGKDIDYVDFRIFSEKGNNYWLGGIAGPNATGGYPKEDWINSSNQINSRSIVNEMRVIGWDFNGKTEDGKSWRYIQIWDEAIYYLVDTIEAKMAFDEIINNSCSTIERYFKD